LARVSTVAELVGRTSISVRQKRDRSQSMKVDHQDIVRERRDVVVLRVRVVMSNGRSPNLDFLAQLIYVNLQGSP
jgi:hypothetical protein